MTQLEEKKMLAEFMGGKVMKCNIVNFTDSEKNKCILVNIDSAYNDYNSLMHVVSKIESLQHEDHIKFNVCIYKNTCWVESRINELYIGSDNENTKLEAIYRACVEFVKWWNENKNETI